MNCKCGKEILVDSDVHYKLMKRTWNCASRSVQAKIAGQTIGIARAIMGDPPEGYVWDHIDRDAHNNVRSNLRLMTKADNMKNKNRYRTNVSGQAGVCWIEREQRWIATIGVEGKKKFLGYFDNKDDAILKRKEAEKQFLLLG